ncbi:hypothetical protein [Mycobacterium shimoidei]|uniref:Uncharacterized protein n=1 Tax=Mycobacterium shimoidei TaxID=29313 RepID=A0A375YTI8_MYCSH|nr:hypothetical protein [Mycobacterium shimoidei]SRX92132.1 hypothetical protein MSP7336_00356 [Mycobacterium shimoidei]
MEPTPAAPSPKIPSSQQEAQDTVLHYLQKTVDGLPPGTVLDSTDFRGGGNVPCDDDYMGPGKPPSEYEYWTHVNGPPGTAPDELIVRAGDLWRSWGFNVIERSGFEKPNRFGYAPDGYKLHIDAAYPPGYPPTLIVSSPCFSGDLVREDIPAPKVIKQKSPGA